MNFDSNDLRAYPRLLPPLLVDRGPRRRYRARARRVQFRSFARHSSWSRIGPEARRALRKFWHDLVRIQRSGPLAVVERRIGSMRIHSAGV